MRNALYLLSIIVMVLIFYSYEVRTENSDLKRAIYAQNTNSLTNASETLTNLQQSVSQSLLFQEKDALNKELDNIWRYSNEMRSSISSLPLSHEVANDWLRYVGKIGEEAKQASNTGDYEAWYKKMEVVNGNLQALSDEWAVATANFYENNGDFSKWDNVASKETNESPFKNVSANLKTYSETDFPLTASEADWKKKRELQNILDKEITKEEAIKRFQKLFPGIKDSALTVTKSKDDAPYPFYHIQYIKGTRIGYADITVKGGYILSFILERPVDEAKITQQEVRKKAMKFLKNAGYTDVQFVEARENHNAWHLSFVRVFGKENALVYPDGIQVKLAKDTGELLGLNAMEYVQKENITDKQIVKPIDWNSFLRPGTIVEEERMIYTENEAHQLRLCYEIIARFNNKLNETFRIVVDGETHEVIKVEYMP